MKPDFWQAYSYINKCCLMLGQYQEASETIDKACQMLIKKFLFKRIGSSFSKLFKTAKEDQLKDSQKRDIEEKNLHYYIKAVCCKMTGRNEEA